MNWKILNIEPTSDKDRIRQAYAKEVKCWHPEEHPKEFRMLQEAYREALRLADQADVHRTAGSASSDVCPSLSLGRRLFQLCSPSGHYPALFCPGPAGF